MAFAVSAVTDAFSRIDPFFGSHASRSLHRENNTEGGHLVQSCIGCRSQHRHRRASLVFAAPLTSVTHRGSPPHGLLGQPLAASARRGAVFVRGRSHIVGVLFTGYWVSHLQHPRGAAQPLCVVSHTSWESSSLVTDQTCVLEAFCACSARGKRRAVVVDEAATGFNPGSQEKTKIRFFL